MQHLYAPWREKYFSKDKDKDECPFCLSGSANDTRLGVIFRAKFCFGIMNLYPYSPGHFMVVPYIHEENIEKLDTEIWEEMSFFVREGVRVLKNKIGARGVNIGMNLGEQAGAGIAKHCHYHLVPRWNGDTNFISTIANTRVCGKDLRKVYEELRIEFQSVLEEKEKKEAEHSASF